MKEMLECVHWINLREPCEDCAALLTPEGYSTLSRIVTATDVTLAIDRLEANQVPSSFYEALNSGDGSYRS
jgi:hypothetical protein